MQPAQAKNNGQLAETKKEANQQNGDIYIYQSRKSCCYSLFSGLSASCLSPTTAFRLFILRLFILLRLWVVVASIGAPLVVAVIINAWDPVI